MDLLGLLVAEEGGEGLGLLNLGAAEGEWLKRPRRRRYREEEDIFSTEEKRRKGLGFRGKS